MINQSPVVFYILLVLGIKSSHGYEIMKQVGIYSDGNVHMGPGTLYGAIKRMLEDALIEECDGSPTDAFSDTRRKYYCLTVKGRKALSIQLSAMQQTISVAREHHLLHVHI
jgi:DNA-binding PadR family transcriptional regulator